MLNRRVGFGALFAFALLCLACQPQDESPGLWLRGESVMEPVEDWSFTREIDEIFVETRPWYGIAHSTTIWCVELDGQLYIGSYGDEQKTWEKNVAREPRAELSIAGMLYRVSLAPVVSDPRVRALDGAYAQKYDMVDVFGEELPSWRYYAVSSIP